MELQHHRLCLENLPVAVSRLRVDGAVPTITQKLTGGQCCVFKADFLSGESWAVRVPLLVSDRAGIRIIIQAEADLLQQLEMKGFLWAPKYQGHDASFNNDIGCPFIALAWIPGNPLSWSDDHPPRSLRDKVLSQMARIQESLIECTKQDGNAVQHFERIIENKIRRVRDGFLPDLTENDCIDQKDRLSAVLHPDLTHAPFAIDHGDLAPQNIIADSDYNISSLTGAFLPWYPSKWRLVSRDSSASRTWCCPRVSLLRKTGRRTWHFSKPDRRKQVHG
ncbi:phosphotransferase enzyme family domain-containing protein [Purpureocillium lilacinum]|uniref:Phosphotransferase enzyme family domain-containing protein n=1 Tax=Purpureocillium lilacinum TaxID=33203 RepID=A0A179F215_PURLI|nr:phosphotransferase enzyme family domain-containing protein [Purpureocillium lilacinum]OAQ59494.1 phosphotransferase enzyme family domain-containing protein [Purpureocillium lilacinum]